MPVVRQGILSLWRLLPCLRVQLRDVYECRIMLHLQRWLPAFWPDDGGLRDCHLPYQLPPRLLHIWIVLCMQCWQVGDTRRGILDLKTIRDSVAVDPGTDTDPILLPPPFLFPCRLHSGPGPEPV